jgi:spore germination cell wall hydrolase CwlJ-like protein
VNPPTVEELKQAKCLATMIYGEARGEAERGMVAVAYTALNRAVNKTVCSVVLAPKQYSIFNNNPELRTAAMSLHLEPRQKNIIDKAGWDQAMMIAIDVFQRKIPDPTNGSTHYLAPIVMKAKGYKYPQWSKQYQLVAVIDNHRFYKEKVISKT